MLPLLFLKGMKHFTKRPKTQVCCVSFFLPVFLSNKSKKYFHSIPTSPFYYYLNIFIYVFYFIIKEESLFFSGEQTKGKHIYKMNQVFLQKTYLKKIFSILFRKCDIKMFPL